MTLKGTPILPHEYRHYAPSDACEALAHNFGRQQEIYISLMLPEDPSVDPSMLDFTPEQASALIAVLLQFIADAEAS